MVSNYKKVAMENYEIKLNLPLEELLNKFSFLKKYENHDWFANLSLHDPKKLDEAYYELSFVLLQDLREFTIKTRFANNWEKNFSVLHRIDQILKILEHFKTLRKNFASNSKGY